MIDIERVSALFWVFGNILIVYSAFALIVFVIGYYILFDPSATTAGKVLFRFMLSLTGVICIAYIGLILFPVTGRPWYVPPPATDLWWAIVRFVIYCHLAFTVTSLAVLLVIRKWFPKRIKSAPFKELVRVRHDTEELDIVNPKTQQ